MRLDSWKKSTAELAGLFTGQSTSTPRFVGVILLWLGLALPAGAGEHHPGTGPEAGSKPAAEALAAGQRAKDERDLARAEAHFQDALAAAERGGDVYDAALEELTYHLPLIRVQRYARAGNWQNAKRSLHDLLEWHQSDEEKRRYLVELIAKLPDQGPARGGVYARKSDGRWVIERIERTLERYLAEHGRYPRGYDELNEILPAGRYPLHDFDIVHYVGRGRAYGLTLRSKTNPDNVLTVQRTGLVR